MEKPNGNIQEIANLDSIMQRRISRVMLVCSEYDQFTLEEDGRLESQLNKEYSDLSLSNPPQFIRMSSGAEALEELATDSDYDLIITMFNIGEMSPFDFAIESKRHFPNIPTVLLTSFSHEVSRRLIDEDTNGFDYIFGWHGSTDLLLAIIKMLEDGMNAENDILRYGVQAVLLVEDSIRFYSAYLPDLYQILLRQVNDFVQEALNHQQRILRKRARPKILFARTYQEATALYERYGKNLLGVISDITFPHQKGDCELMQQAGIELVKQIRARDPQIPVLLQSSELEMKQTAQEMNIDFIHKQSKTLFDELAGFIGRRMAFGDFVFCDPGGRKVCTVSDIAQMHQAAKSLPDQILWDYASQNMFSKWFYARGIFTIANTLRHVSIDSFENTDQMRAYLVSVIRLYRQQMSQGVIAEFKPETYNGYITFARSGSGSLGGKARGLAFLASLLEKHNLYHRWEGVRVNIPRTLVLATDHFDQFMSENGLNYILEENESLEDWEILNEFVGARLSDHLMEELKVFVQSSHRPLAVRSSSKLEDSHYQPFAGIYSTYMVPSMDNVDRQARLVAKAIKSVYASVFYKASRSYIDTTSNILSEEKMAIVIQEVCGTEDNGYYFPTISGVARSINFYPIGDELPEEGVCSIVLGMGKMVVEGGQTLRFSPKYPRHALQTSTPELTLRDTQREFYAIDLNPASLRTSTDDSVNLVRLDVNQHTNLRNLRHVCSTWDMQNQRIADTFDEQGRKLVTFAHQLKYGTIPLAEIIAEMLRIGEEAMKSPVEIEFAVDLDVPASSLKRFKLLQIRPIVDGCGNSDSLDWNKVDTTEAILYAEAALGIGQIDGLTDIVYIRPERFDPSKSESMAAEIADLNERMKKEGRNYILIGPGRWGSSDSWLGIPVKWSQISESRVIAECGLPNYRIDPSQGTHFFQNLTSFGVGYLTLNPSLGDGKADFSILDSMDAVYETIYMRHVRFAEPLYVFVDGQNNKAIIKIDKNKPQD